MKLNRTSSHDLSVLTQHLSLRLPFWHRRDIEAELASHLQEVAAELQVQGMEEEEAQAEARQRFGELGGISESLQAIHQGWIGGATVQQRFVKVLTVVVIAVCLLATPFVPPIRKIVRELSLIVQDSDRTRQFPDAEFARAVAARHPQDAAVALAAAYIPDPGQWRQYVIGDAPLAPDLDALQAAVTAHPQDAAGHFFLGCRRLEQVVQITNKKLKTKPAAKAALLQQVDFSSAREQLKAAARCDPNNAAPHYLLAYTFLINNNTTSAARELRIAQACPDWRTYRSELGRGVLAIFNESTSAQIPGLHEVAIIAGTDELLAPEYVEALVKLLAGRAQSARVAARHAEALFFCRAILHLAQIELHGATGLTDAVVVRSNVRLLAKTFVTDIDRRALQAQHVEKREMATRLDKLGAARLESYLLFQKQPDLAKQSKQLPTEARNLVSVILRANRQNKQLDSFMSEGGFGIAVLLFTLAACALAMLLLTGIASLAARSWRTEGTAPVWFFGQWLVFGLVSLLAFPLALLILGILERKYLSAGSWFVAMQTAMIVVPILGALLVPVLLFVVPIVGALRKRRRQPMEIRMGRFQAILASYRILLPPTFALLLLVAIIWAIPAGVALQRAAAQQKQIIQVGELAYWKSQEVVK
jgi:hypothetical protein